MEARGVWAQSASDGLLCSCLALVRYCYAWLVSTFLGLGCSAVLGDSSVREVGRGWDELTGLADYFLAACFACRGGVFTCPFA